MYQAIINILGAIFLPMIWLHILKVPTNLLIKTGLRVVKPFGCGFCLAFWISFFSFILKTNLINSIFISSAVPFLYLYVEDYITNKWEL